MIPLEWDECPDCDTCELILSFLELTDSLVHDLQHLKAETMRARYQWRKQLDPEKSWTTNVDMLSNLVFFARPFWKKLQSKNGQTCMSKRDKVARIPGTQGAGMNPLQTGYCY